MTLDYKPEFLSIDEDDNMVVDIDEDIIEDIDEDISYEHWEEDDKIFYGQYKNKSPKILALLKKLTDGKLKFQNTRVTAPLTFRFLEECLNECINGEEQVKQIIKYIKSKREVKYVPDIKRSYSQTT